MVGILRDVLRARADRRVVTAVFVDVVDSTRIAATLGDRRWRELLTAFRGTVRRHLRQNGGREVDTAGDGFFATFSSPAAALRAASKIVSDVQAHGLDVRCGLHTGELERMEGQLGGLGAHIAARVMAQAGAAQVLTTATVRDLVVGGAATFEDIGAVELKGVPGRWVLHRLTAMDGRPLPAALDADEAESRRTVALGGRSRARLAAIGAGGIAAAAATIAFMLVTSSGAGGPPISSPSPSPPIALLKIDPDTREVVAAVRDPSLPPFGGFVQVADGNLWYSAGDRLERRDLATGAVLSPSIKLPPEWWRVEAGLGFIWIGHGWNEPPTQLPSLIDQLEPASGRRLDQIDPGMAIWDFAVGDEAVYLLSPASKILEVDPFSNEIVDRVPTRTETDPAYISYQHGHLWLFEGSEHRATEFDPVTNTVVGALEGPQIGFGWAGIDPLTGDFWSADRGATTITPFDLPGGEAGRPVGLEGVPRNFAFGFRAIWLAAEEYVYRIDSYTHEAESIPVPEGVVATSVGIDEETQTIWISTCAVDCEDPI